MQAVPNSTLHQGIDLDAILKDEQLQDEEEQDPMEQDTIIYVVPQRSWGRPQ